MRFLKLVLVLAFVGFSAGQELVSLTNGQVVVVVDRVTGQFAIGSASGMPVIEGFPDDPHHTHLIIRCGGETYSNLPGLADYDLILRDTAAVYDNTLSIVWNVSAMIAWKKFYTLDVDSLRQFIYIENAFYNESPDSVPVGFLEYMDVRVGDNDAPTVEVPGSVFTTECGFAADDVPAYWTLFRNYGDTICDVAAGVPIGRDMLYADRIIFSDVDYVDSVLWDFMPLSRGIDDLAVLIRWDERYLGPYEVYLTGYYYGLGYPNWGVGDTPYFEPSSFVVSGPFPNPTNGATRICVDVVGPSSPLEIAVFDRAGRLVKVLFDGLCGPGKHSFTWSLEDGGGREVSSGIYFVEVRLGGHVCTRRVAVVR